MVRLNHLSNGMICHPLSLNKADRVRGRVPIPGDVPPIVYDELDSRGTFVRADTTYLRQDFSVMHPVKNRGSWAADR